MGDRYGKCLPGPDPPCAVRVAVLQSGFDDRQAFNRDRRPREHAGRGPPRRRVRRQGAGGGAGRVNLKIFYYNFNQGGIHPFGQLAPPHTPTGGYGIRPYGRNRRPRRPADLHGIANVTSSPRGRGRTCPALHLPINACPLDTSGPGMPGPYNPATLQISALYFL